MRIKARVTNLSNHRATCTTVFPGTRASDNEKQSFQENSNFSPICVNGEVNADRRLNALVDFENISKRVRLDLWYEYRKAI